MHSTTRLKKIIPRLIPLCLACFTCPGKVTAQVTLFYNETAVSIPEGSLFIYKDSSKNHDWGRYNTIKENLVPYPGKKISLSFLNEMVWLRLKSDRLKFSDKLNYLMIRNPNINYLRVWLLQNDSILKEFPLTGDRLPFASRAIHHSDFVFPLSGITSSGFTLLILADKRNEMLAVPIHLMTEDGLLQYSGNKNLMTGLITGLSLFLFFFNLFLFFQMKERLYVFYGLYILMCLLYIFSDNGLSFMTLFPNNPIPSDLMRPLSISLATPLYLLFCLELLRIKKELPFYHRWMMRGLLVYFAIFLFSIPFLYDLGKTRVMLQNLMQVLLTLLVLSNLLIAIIALRKKLRYAIYLIISNVLLLLTISFFVLYLSGNIADNLFTRNLMNIGFMGEISLLAFVLSLRFKHYKEHSEVLLRKSNLEQEQIFKSVTDYKEKELQRLSSLLHDSVGARLSALRFNLESGIDETGHDSKLKNFITEINDLANEVRMFSHNLSPVLLQQKGLRDALEQFIKPINESGKLWIQFEMIGSSERNLFRYELMVYNIIQELAQNIIKHSGATEAIIQLIMEEDLVSIYAEDNGKGFDTTIKKDGLGLSQIKQLVIFVNGSLRIHSSEGKGSRISIEFITLPDERKHPVNHSR